MLIIHMYVRRCSLFRSIRFIQCLKALVEFGTLTSSMTTNIHHMIPFENVFHFFLSRPTYVHSELSIRCISFTEAFPPRDFRVIQSKIHIPLATKYKCSSDQGFSHTPSALEYHHMSLKSGFDWMILKLFSLNFPKRIIQLSS